MTIEEKKTPLDTWAIVEAMGHRRYVGHITETTVAGAPMLRIDVPDVGEHQKHTVFLAPSALYALTPIDEETALAVVGNGESQEPMQAWTARRLLAPPQPAEVVDGTAKPDDDDADIAF